MIITTKSFRNKAALEQSAACVCYYCQREVGFADITEWVDKGQTACCPHCRIDSVVGFTGAFDPALVEEMHYYWFCMASELAQYVPSPVPTDADLQ